MTTARERVVTRLARRVEQFPDLELTGLDASGLEARDAALALAIDHAVARRWLTLRTVLSSRLARPWDAVEPKLRAVLLAGAAQCLLLDRVPDHAAINEAVELARRFVRPGAAGLVNAVLRRTADLRVEVIDEHDGTQCDLLPLSDGRAWRLREPVFSESAVTRCAEQTSHPQPLLDRWNTALGSASTEAIAQHGLVHAPVIITGLDVAPAGCQPHARAGFWIHTGSHDALVALLREHPGARVQDPTSAHPVQATASLGPRLIVDACAGRGTKTRQLAALHPDARILAIEPEAARRAILVDSFADDDRVRVVDAEQLEAHRGTVDLLVLDVPCSNTGVLARRVEARYRCAPSTLDQLIALQRRIMSASVGLLAPRGHLLYATCSIEAAENREQVAWLTRHHGLRVVEERLQLPEGRPGDPPTRYVDGGYWALLARSAVTA